MTEAQIERCMRWVAWLLGAGLVLWLCGCWGSREVARDCGVRCIVYDHDLSFVANLERFPVDVDSSEVGVMVFLPGEGGAADWVVDSTLAMGPLVIEVGLIEEIELFEAVHTRRLDGFFGEYGIFWVRTRR